MLKFVVAVAVVGVLISLCFQPDSPITGNKIKLGQQGYTVEILDAPTATSTLLDVLSYVLTKSRFGPALRRHLLNTNNIALLRDMASQIDHPPMSFPMRRVNAAQYEALSSPEALVEAEGAFLNGFATNFLPAHDRENPAADPYPRTIMEYHAFYKEGKILPSQVMQKALDAVKSWEAKGFRIFSSILPEEVMRAARESDERWRQGAPRSVFDGVPVAFKDMMEVAGHIIYQGRNPGPSHEAEWKRSEVDDLMVARLKHFGAIVFGVTIEVEGGVSPLGFNAHFQGPVNPYSMNRYSGGSSSGSAVAVATGIVPVAIGYDGGGSIRLPGKTNTNDTNSRTTNPKMY